MSRPSPSPPLMSDDDRRRMAAIARVQASAAVVRAAQPAPSHTDPPRVEGEVLRARIEGRLCVLALRPEGDFYIRVWDAEDGEWCKLAFADLEYTTAADMLLGELARLLPALPSRTAAEHSDQPDVCVCDLDAPPSWPPSARQPGLCPPTRNSR